MKKYYVFLLIIILSLTFINFVFAGRGCCSWHGGQSYCDTSSGRRVCNDGTYSPTCRCAQTNYTTTRTNTNTDNDTNVINTNPENYVIPSCPENSYRNTSGECICKEGYKYDTLKINCEYNQDYHCNKYYPGTVYRSYDNQCVCPRNLNTHDLSSRSSTTKSCEEDDSYCRYNFGVNSEYNTSTNGCVCKTGYSKNSNGICSYTYSNINTSNNSSNIKTTTSNENSNSDGNGFLGLLVVGGLIFWGYQKFKKK